MAAKTTKKGGRPPRVTAALNAAMLAIEQDVDQAGGVYPFNGGRLSQAELCRRAQVTPATLQNPNHVRTTLPWVNRWLADSNKALVRGKASVRRAITLRTDDARYELAKALTQLNLSQIELARVTAERDAAIENVTQERSINAALREELRASRRQGSSRRSDVIPI